MKHLLLLLTSLTLFACGGGDSGDAMDDAAAGDAMEAAGDAMDDAGDMAGDALDAATDMADDAADAAGAMADDAKDSLTGAMDDASGVEDMLMEKKDDLDKAIDEATD